MNKAVFGKLWEMLENIEILNLPQQKEEGIVQHENQVFTENLLTMEMKKTQLLMNKLAHLELSILELSKILMYEFCMIM